MASEPRETVQLSQRAYEDLREGILKLRLQPGMQLVERDLAAELEMSITPVREALQRLEHEGLVTKEPFRGARVLTLTLKDAAEIYELRELFEGRCARICATHSCGEDLRKMEELMDQADEHLRQHDLNGCGRMVWDAHDLIMGPVKNDRLRSLLKTIRTQAQLIGTITTYIPGRQAKSVAEHRALLEALKAGDPEQAELAMTAHLRSLHQDLKDDFEAGGLSRAFLQAG
jgi:DNA-binding GntR family transcriptional regulator